MDFALTEQQELIRKEVASLARSFPPEYWLEKDGKAEYPWEFVKAFAAGRLARRDHSRGVRRLGAGRHRGRADAARHRRLRRGHQRLLAHPLLLLPADAGHQARQRRPQAAGICRASPPARSSCRSASPSPTPGPTPRASRRAPSASGDRFIVNGRKVWNTNAQNATHILLLARTAPRDPAKPFKGLTLFFTEFDRDEDHRAGHREARAGPPSTPTRSTSTASRCPLDERGGRGGPGLLPPARLAQPRADLHRHRGGRHRPRRAGPRRRLRQGARRLRPPDRPEPGDRPPAGAWPGPSSRPPS